MLPNDYLDQIPDDYVDQDFLDYLDSQENEMAEIVAHFNEYEEKYLVDFEDLNDPLGLDPTEDFSQCKEKTDLTITAKKARDQKLKSESDQLMQFLPNLAIKNVTKNINAPIEFKKIDSKRFNNYNWSHTAKIKINKTGHLDTKDGLRVLDYNTKNTTVLNIGTGMGKTTLVYNMIREVIMTDPEAVVIMCSPFISIVEKDYSALTNPNGKFKVDPLVTVNYVDLSNEIDNYKTKPTNRKKIQAFVNSQIIGKKLHIMTVNCFLGNSGSDVYFQNQFKEAYVNGLLKYCQKNTKNVYIIVDEVHASVQNFQNELIYNLLRWKSITQKCIISSATITEPVIIVLKHFSYLTDDNIHVVELDRIKAINQANLEVFLSRKDDVENELDIIPKWLDSKGYYKKSTTNTKKFHILCWSKSLAEKIAKNIETLTNTSIRKNEINLVVGGKNNTQLNFDPTKNNVGTSFATGVDIVNSDDALIIILPSIKYNNYGIFSNGIPSIIQSFARLRNGGNILVMAPQLFNLIPDKKTNAFLGFYKKNMGPIPAIISRDVDKYFTYEERVIKKRYNDRKKKYKLISSNYIRDTAAIEVNGGAKKGLRPAIDKISIDSFILRSGQEFLVSHCYKSGKEITPFIIWSALHNQFTNCTLTKFLYERTSNASVLLTRKNFYTEFTVFLNSTDIKDIKTKSKNLGDNDLFKLIIKHMTSTTISSITTTVDLKMEISKNGKIYQKNNSIKTNTGREYVLSYMSHLRTGSKDYFELQDYFNYRVKYSKSTSKDKSTIAYYKLKNIIDSFYNKHKIKGIPLKGKEIIKYPSVSSFFTPSIKKTFEDAIDEIRQNDVFLKGSSFTSLNNKKLKKTVDLYNAFITEFFIHTRGAKSSGSVIQYCHYINLPNNSKFPFC